MVQRQRDGLDDGRMHSPSELWILKLYVAGRSARCVKALTNLTRICEEYLAGKYRIDVIDLLQKPHLAREHQIFAVPTVIKGSPPPVRKIVGDLSDEATVLGCLELGPLE